MNKNEQNQLITSNVQSKIYFLAKSSMNFIGNLFKTTSKDTNNDAITKNRVRFYSPQKVMGHVKRESYSEDNNWREISLDTSFYIQKLIEVKLGVTDIIPKSRNQSSHMVYEICVLTSDFQYSIRKRFSVFHQFYNQIKKQISHLNLVFPKKTLLVSGTNIQVVSERYQILNNFIKRVFTQVKQHQNQIIGFRFINFIQIQDQVQKRKVKTYSQLPRLPQQMTGSFSVEQTSITFELKKLNDYSTHQIDILSRLQSYIIYKNYKLTNDQIKTLLIGNSASNIKGLVNLSLSINNQIKSLELLKFMIDYLSPQKKSYNDKIYKQFEKIPLQAFHFDFQHIKNNFNVIEFKKMFFILLQLYCHNKFFDQTKILQKYPKLLSELMHWKNLACINHGKLSKKTSSASNQQFQQLLKAPSMQNLKAKSFEINPKFIQTRPQTSFPFTTADNLDNLAYKSTRSEEKPKKCSFMSNDSTSELTIEEDWENCKMKLQLGESFKDSINEKINESLEIIKSSQIFSLKSNKCNKIIIQILKAEKEFKLCEQISSGWNKLIYDERHDQFTGISRIYMKLNGKSKIFKFRQQDEKIQKKDEKFVLISKKRLQSYNSISKSGKQNIEDCLKFKASTNSKGFEEIISVENIEQISNQQNEIQRSYRKVKIEFNFEGEEQYFRTQIMGSTTYLLDNALEAYLK